MTPGEKQPLDAEIAFLSGMASALDELAKLAPEIKALNDAIMRVQGPSHDIVYAYLSAHSLAHETIRAVPGGRYDRALMVFCIFMQRVLDEWQGKSGPMKDDQFLALVPSAELAASLRKHVQELTLLINEPESPLVN